MFDGPQSDKPLNWLRVLGSAKVPQIDQRVSQQLHTVVPLLHVLKTQEQPLELIFPRKGPFYPRSRIGNSADRKFKSPLAPPAREHAPQRHSPAATPRPRRFPYAQRGAAALPVCPSVRRSAAQHGPLGLDARRRMGEGRRPPEVEQLGESGEGRSCEPSPR